MFCTQSIAVEHRLSLAYMNAKLNLVHKYDNIYHNQVLILDAVSPGSLEMCQNIISEDEKTR